MSRLKDLYKNEIMDAMTKKFGYKNVMEVPKLEKIVVNMGVGEAKENAKLLDAAIADMELDSQRISVNTKVRFHNSLGKYYFAIIKPFHNLICKTLLQRAKNNIEKSLYR